MSLTTSHLSFLENNKFEFGLHTWGYLDGYLGYLEISELLKNTDYSSFFIFCFAMHSVQYNWESVNVLFIYSSLELEEVWQCLLMKSIC